MKKQTLLCCIFIAALNWSSFAQKPNADSLKRVVAKNARDSNQVKALNQLAISCQFTNPDSALALTTEALAIAGDRYALQRGQSWNIKGQTLYMKGDYPGSLQAFENYFTAAKEAGNRSQMGFALNNAANIYIETGDYTKALDKHKEALDVREKAKDRPGVAMSYNNIGFIYKDLGDYDKALSNFFFALREYEQMKDETGLAATYTYIAIIYLRKKDWIESIATSEKALVLQRKNKDLGGQGISLSNLADCYDLQGNLDKSLEYRKQTLEIFKSANDIRQIALAQSSLADLYFKKEDYTKALEGYKEAMKLNTEIGNKRSAAAVWISAAATHIKLNQFAEAKTALDTAVVINKQTGKKEDIKNYYKTLSAYYQAAGDAALALENYKLYSDVKDSLLNQDKLRSMAAEQTKYETEKKEQQIHLQQAKLARRNIIIFAIAGIGLLAAWLGYSYYRRYKLKQEARLQSEIFHQQQMAARSVLEAEEKERQRIASELHDGVGQLMSVAKMNLSVFENTVPLQEPAHKVALEKIMDLVDHSAKEVRAVSHQLMPNALVKSGLARALHEFISQIDQRALEVQLYTEGLDQTLDSNTESVLYRVIQECVNNVIKHAGATRLDISLVRDNNDLSVTIEDNGRGFDPARISEKAGLGLNSIRSRIGFLRGTVDFDTTPGKGVLVAIHIPLSK
jgi:two-component system, NarL family, sensor kinase